MERTDRKYVLYLNVNFENTMILLMLLFSGTISLASIFYAQAGAPIATCSVIINIGRLGLMASSAVLVAGIYVTRKETFFHPFVLNAYAYMLYILVPSLAFYSPSAQTLMAGAFSWPLAFVGYYLYAEEHEFTPFFRQTLTLICCLGIGAMARTISLRFLLGTNTGSINHLITMIPLVLYFLRGRTRTTIVALIAVLTLLSLKRAAMIVLVIGLICYYICLLNQKNMLRERIKSIFLISAATAVILALMLYFNLGEAMLGRFATMTEDGGSGRIGIWEHILEAYHNLPAVQRVLGRGFHALPALVRPLNRYIFAHNSYITALYDLGLVGAVWLGLIVVVMIVYLVWMIIEKNDMAPAASFAMCAILTFSLVSYFFDECGCIVSIVAFWGAFMGGMGKRADPVLPKPRAASGCQYIR